jgi:hypothetical protein
VNDYYQWLSGKPKKLVAAFPAARVAQHSNDGQFNATQTSQEAAAKPIEVQESSATETFIGRVRDFWNGKK